MKKLPLLLISLLAALGMLMPVLTPLASAADPVDLKAETKCSGSECIPEASDPAANIQCTKDNCDLVAKYLNPFIRILTAIVVLAATFGIAFGGVEYASSGGDPSKASSGKKHIISAVVALVAYFFLFAALNFLIPGGV